MAVLETIVYKGIKFNFYKWKVLIESVSGSLWFCFKGEVKPEERIKAAEDLYSLIVLGKILKTQEIRKVLEING